MFCLLEDPAAVGGIVRWKSNAIIDKYLIMPVQNKISEYKVYECQPSNYLPLFKCKSYTKK